MNQDQVKYFHKRVDDIVNQRLSQYQSTAFPSWRKQTYRDYDIEDIIKLKYSKQEWAKAVVKDAESIVKKVIDASYSDPSCTINVKNFLRENLVSALSDWADNELKKCRAKINEVESKLKSEAAKVKDSILLGDMKYVITAIHKLETMKL